MSKSFAQVAAIALATVLTFGTFAGANAMASHQYTVASDVAMAQAQQAAAQHVATIAHRRANA